MASAIRISDAAAISIHAAMCMASDPARYWSVRAVGARFRVSPAHLAKVLRALGRAGIVTAVRGPHGGAKLARPPGQVSLLQVYEAIDGPMVMHACLLAPEGCGSACCQLAPRLAAVNDDLRALFARTTLADLARQVPEVAA